MKLLVTILFVGVSAALGQTPVPGPAKDQPAAEQQPKASEDQQGEAHRSTVEVKPGPPAIKQKDLWDGTGYFHPFVRMPKYILQDQKAIWTSPFHTAKKDIKLWAIFGAATAAVIATDRHTVNQLPNSSSQVSVSTWGSRFGAAYTLIPLSAGFYFIGTPTHQERFRETGLLCFEALIDSNLVVEGVKLAADRARPLESDGHGHFEDSPGTRFSSGFPSGHAISSWAMASVIAHQYPHPRIIPILAYGLASTVVVARVGARQHFPGDVVAGSALGWFIGDYTYGRRHNRELDGKPTVAERLLDHIHLGMEIR
ncbi:MAG: phosphatase PAP2 family protein [Acidobacteriia bacterium]|nr:phosphatase PAP2 family protein [Terriglobia bacterium]